MTKIILDNIIFNTGKKNPLKFITTKIILEITLQDMI